MIGNNRELAHFIASAKKNHLLIEHEHHYQFLSKLYKDYPLDRIRLENLIMVYANEAAPIKAIRFALIKALKNYSQLSPQQLSKWYFDDEYRLLAWEKNYYNKPRYQAINQLEQFTEDPAPFLLHPKQSNGLGILLIHGLLASPAEVYGYGQHICQQGYTVLGVRIKGHGTSPYALQNQDRKAWYSSVLQGYHILNSYCDDIIVLGFSTGGVLAAMLAVEPMLKLRAMIVISVPLKFVDKTFVLVPLLHGSNKLFAWISTLKGLKPFLENNPEHPSINYRHTPVSSLYELHLLIEEVEAILEKITLPCLVIYADKDPVVSIDSGDAFIKKLGSKNKQLKIVHTQHHGILMDNSEDTWAIIDRFLETLV
jgi:esterase/lipase